MKNRIVLAALAVLVASTLAAPRAAHAAIPELLRVQGVVRTNGTAFSGPANIRIQLWDDPSGGFMVFDEAFGDVPLTGGVLDLTLGATIGLPAAAMANGTALWVQIVVDGLPVGGRVALMPVAYSFHAMAAGRLACDACVTADQVAFPFAVASSKGGAAQNSDHLDGFTWTTVPETTDVWVNESGDTMSGPLTVAGLFTAQAAGSINGALTVGGGITAGGKVNANGGAMIVGPLEVVGPTALTGDTAITGTTTISGNTAITGSATVSASASVGTTLNLAPQAAAPTGKSGDVYFDATKQALQVHNGAGWNPVGAGVPKGTILFGQTADDPEFTNNGFEPIESSLRLGEGWSPTKITGAPSARELNSCTATGTYVVCWGGRSSSTVYLANGARYRPATDSWSAISATGAPAARGNHSALWTGTEVLMWGGRYYSATTLYRKDGARYVPSTDKWNAMAAGPATLVARDYHSAVWTGSRMVIWGGYNGAALDDGARYDPTPNTWTSMFKGPSKRYSHSTVWTGTKMIIWGGNSGTALLADGAAYDPSTDTWAGIAAAPAGLTARAGHTATWVGDRMIVYGGTTVITPVTADKSGASYDPVSNTWTMLDTSTVADSRVYHSAVWTGSLLLMWGGQTGAATYSNTGDIYDPAQDIWLPMNGLGAPSARYAWAYGATWTGLSLVVVGGYGGAVTNTGGVYQPGLTLYPYRKL